MEKKFNVGNYEGALHAKKKRPNYFTRLWNALLDREVEPVVPLDEQLVVFLKGIWVQKQMDDLLLMSEQVRQQLKAKPFHGPYLEKRDKLHSDINTIQPILLNKGITCARIIEQEYGVQFYLLSGRGFSSPAKQPEPDKNQPVEKKEETTEEKAKKIGLVIPGKT